MTRVQAERFAEPERAEAVRGSYSIDAEVLRRIGRDTTSLHPLPRVNEVDYSVDQDARAAYFRQASYGVPIRMALMALLLGRKRLRRGRRESEKAAAEKRAKHWVTTVRCQNPTCITNNERGMLPRMEAVGDTGLLRCAYCDQEQEASAASGGEK